MYFSNAKSIVFVIKMDFYTKLKIVIFSLAMPPFPPFAAPFGPMVAQSGLFRNAGPGGRNGQNPSGNGGGSGGSGRGLPRGFDGGPWPWAGGWGGDGNWPHHQPRGHMSTPW